MEPTKSQMNEWRCLCTGVSASREKFGAVPINEAIAAADRYANASKAVSTEPDDSGANRYHRYHNLSNLLCWFRDRMGSSSVADVLDAIGKRRVDLAVVRIWVSELFGDNVPITPVEHAIAEAYPEVRGEMRQQRAEWISETFDRIRHVVGQR